MSKTDTTSLQGRIDNYVRETKFPRSLFVSGDGRIVGTWIMGNDYRVKSEYYGGYPAGYLRRVKALFPDKRRVLHLFSGKVDLATLPGDTVDINADLAPSYVDDAQTLERVPLDQYDLVLADPPYSVEDCERYQTAMVKRNTVMRALQRLHAGSHIVWLDQVLPMYRKDAFAIEAVIGMVKSTNHRFRVVTVFRRNETTDLCLDVNPHQTPLEATLNPHERSHSEMPEIPEIPGTIIDSLECARPSLTSDEFAKELELLGITRAQFKRLVVARVRQS